MHMLPPSLVACFGYLLKLCTSHTFHLNHQTMSPAGLSACLLRYVFQDLGGRLLQGPLAQKAGTNAIGFLQKSILDAKASGLLTQVG